jgi:polyphosphate kinase
MPGMSENVHVRSVLGRFLEHSRVLAFETDESTTLYLGSADLMPRNLDHRIEVLVPVEQTRLRQELESFLDSLFTDNTGAWQLSPDGSWARLATGKDERAHNHQAALIRRALVRSRRQASQSRGRGS